MLHGTDVDMGTPYGEGPKHEAAVEAAPPCWAPWSVGLGGRQSLPRQMAAAAARRQRGAGAQRGGGRAPPQAQPQREARAVCAVPSPPLLPPSLNLGERSQESFGAV